MKKQNIIKKNSEFNRIINLKKIYKVNEYLMFIDNTIDKTEKFKIGISVSKKIGNAVIRNKIKRQIKTMIDNNKYKQGTKCIIIVKKTYLFNKYDVNKEALYLLFKKADILQEEKNET